MKDPNTITVETTVKAPVAKLWEYWTSPEHITGWNNASEDWHTPHAENDLRKGGRFLSRMEARDGSVGFDFRGVYDVVEKNELIEYTLDDGREVRIVFSDDGDHTTVTETFNPENVNPLEMQKGGWQAILDNFKKYAEAKTNTAFRALHFTVGIRAPKEKVWQTMLEDETYREWTSVFQEGSYFKGSWDQGSKILFLDAKGYGMVATIVENRPYEFISIENAGLVLEGVEDTASKEAKAFSGAHQNYTFREEEGETELSIDLDTNDEYEALFEGVWPKALAKLKSLSER